MTAFQFKEPVRFDLSIIIVSFNTRDVLLDCLTSVYAKTEDISFENMKNAGIYGSNLASFCVEKFGTERMEDLHNNEVQDRLKVFKELTQFDIKLT